MECKGAILSALKMGKGLHKVFNAFVKEISQDLTFLGESRSEVSYFNPELRNFDEVNRPSDGMKKPWTKATLEDIKNLIHNQTFIVQETDNSEPVTPCMDVEKSKIQSDGSLDKLKLRIVVKGDPQNKELFRDTWSPTDSMRTLKYFFGICS